MITKVCRVMGTGVPGTGISPAAEAAHSRSANSTGLNVEPNLPLDSDLMVRIAWCMKSP